MPGEVRCVWDVEALLGEGPVWFADEGALWFVDIKRHRIHRFDPASGDKHSWEAPDQIGWVQRVASGGYLAGLKTGIHRFDPETGAFTLLLDPEPDLPDNRLNDSCVAPDGRLWFGTMDDGQTQASGRFYRLADGPCAIPLDFTCPITNGPAVSPDGRTLYLVDTLAGHVYRRPLDAAGEAGPAELFVTIDPADGHPDGPSVDADGNVWIGLYGGWAARRYAPDGTLLDHVRLPVANVTKLAFGGPDLRTAYLTTAGQQLDEAARAAQPLAGGLFAFALDVPGTPVPPVRLG